MKGRHVTIAVVLLALIATATPTFARKKSQNEEGNWNLKVTPDASAVAQGEKAFNDTLILQQGFLRSKYNTDQHGSRATTRGRSTGRVSGRATPSPAA